jgi:hypothetical protein
MGDYLIGVQARMEDAALLADAERYEGALLMMLVALSATSRRCYPEIKPAGEAFKKFIEERNRHFTGLEEALRKVNWPGSVADFLWKTLRCNLEHEGQLDEEQHPHRPGVLVTLTGNKSNGVGLTTYALVNRKGGHPLLGQPMAGR